MIKIFFFLKIDLKVYYIYLIYINHNNIKINVNEPIVLIFS